MKQIIENLQSAVDKKANILNKYLKQEEPYYHKELVTVKHRHKIGPFWDNPTYSQHEEIRYNQELFEKDFTKAHAEVATYESQVALNIQQLEEDIKNAELQKNKVGKDLNQLLNKNLQLEQEIKNREGYFEFIEQEFAPLKEQYDEVELRIDDINNQIQTFNHLPESNQPVEQMVDRAVYGFSLQTRSAVLFDLWGLEDEDSLEMLDSIIKHGFDANYQNHEEISLLRKAASLNDLNLLKIVLLQDQKSAEELNLLGFALEKSNNEFVIKLLEAEADFSFAVKDIINKDHLNSFQRLLSLQPELINKDILDLAFQYETNNIKSELSGNTETFKLIFNQSINQGLQEIVVLLAKANQDITNNTHDDIWLDKLLGILDSSQDTTATKIAADLQLKAKPQILLNVQAVENNIVPIIGEDKIDDNISEGSNHLYEFDNY